MRDIASGSRISAGSVETIIHEHVFVKKMSTWWVPKTLLSEKDVQSVAMSAKHLQQFKLENILGVNSDLS